MHAATGKLSQASALPTPQAPTPEEARRATSASENFQGCSWHATQVRVDVYISFGGLLMQLTGDPTKLEDLHVDSQVYLLMRKV